MEDNGKFLVVEIHDRELCEVYQAQCKEEAVAIANKLLADHIMKVGDMEWWEVESLIRDALQRAKQTGNLPPVKVGHLQISLTDGASSEAWADDDFDVYIIGPEGVHEYAPNA